MIVAGLRLPKDRARPAAEFSCLRDDDILATVGHSTTLSSLAARSEEPEDERFPPGVEGDSRRVSILGHHDLAPKVAHTPSAIPNKGKRIPILRHFGLTCCLRINREQ